MKVHLMFADHDFAALTQMAPNKDMLTQDLELNTLFNAMAGEDDFLLEVAKKAIFTGFYHDERTILYRQAILQDCLTHPTIVRSMYSLTVETIESKKKHWFFIFTRTSSSVISYSMEMLSLYEGALKQLKKIAEAYAPQFKSKGFTQLFTTLQSELNDDYFINMKQHINQLKFRKGILLSAQLGKDNKGTHYILNNSQIQKKNWLQQLFTKNSFVHTFSIHPRDESGFNALSDLKDEALYPVAQVLLQATEHIEAFFTMLRTELAFYLGCLNLHETLTQIGMPTTFPLMPSPNECKYSFKGLYDVSLLLKMNQKIICNEMNADNKNLVLITGANQGGKSTFLRSIGLSQLMMQAGMFVPAESFCANLCDALFTHYKKEEDTTLERGKFDEELARMSDIVDHMTPNSLLLFNESFAATNDHEGSEIARQIISALLIPRIKVFFVTHLYECARGFYNQKMENVLFLRATRDTHGKRSFKVLEGEPLQTSYGEDLYHKIFDKNN